MGISRHPPGAAQDDGKPVASKRCHIGQPMHIFKEVDTWYAALHAAVGARLIIGVELYPMHGDSPPKRLSRELTLAITILKKFLVTGHDWDYLSEDNSGHLLSKKANL